MQTPHPGVARGPIPEQRRRSPLTWLLLAGLVGLLLVIVAFAASGGLGSQGPSPIIRPPGNGAAAPAPVPTATPSSTPTAEGKHKHGDGTPGPPGDGG